MLVAELFIRRILQGIADLLYTGIIELLLLGIGIGIIHFFHLVRQVLEHIFLQTAQDKRADHLLQHDFGIRILVPDDWQLEGGAEPVIGEEESRHDEVKDGPELAEPVFNRRACQSDAELCIDILDGLGCHCAGILDVLCFIDDFYRKSFILIEFHILFQQVVGCDQDIGLICLFHGIFAFCGSTDDGDGFEVRSELLYFLIPVVYKGGRADNQGFAKAFVRIKKGEYLQGFAKAHFIGEQGTKAIVVQGAEPAESFLLVITHDAFQPFRWLVVIDVGAFDVGDQTAEFGVPVNFETCFPAFFFQVHCSVLTNLNAAIFNFTLFQLQGIGKIGKFIKLAAIIQVNEFSAFKPEEFLLAVIMGQDLSDLFWLHGSRANVQLQQIIAVIDRNADGDLADLSDCQLLQSV